MIKTEYLPVSSLKKGDWHSNHVLRPDLLTLSVSLQQYGFIFPILVRKSDNAIIDGYHRWMLIKENEKLAKKLGDEIPCVVRECDTLEASLMHIQLNRGRGNLVAHKVARIVRDLIYSNKYSEEDLEKLLSMKYDELHLLLDGTLIKKLNIAEHRYSRAWVPIEAPAGTVEAFETERPPNKDR